MTTILRSWHEMQREREGGGVGAQWKHFQKWLKKEPFKVALGWCSTIFTLTQEKPSTSPYTLHQTPPPPNLVLSFLTSSNSSVGLVCVCVSLRSPFNLMYNCVSLKLFICKACTSFTTMGFNASSPVPIQQRKQFRKLAFPAALPLDTCDGSWINLNLCSNWGPIHLARDAW